MATLNQIGRTLARNTAILRKDAALNLSDMERMTGVSRRTLGRIEKARKERRPYSPMLKTVLKLAETAGVSVDDYIKTSF
jgi:Predicted transcriptional regulators